MKLSRLLAGVGLVAVVGLTGTACTTHAGAAAQVGSSTIDTSDLRGIVDRGLDASRATTAEQSAQGAPQSLDQGELQRRTLTTLVQLKLLTAEAKRLGVSVSGQDVASYYQAYGILNFGSVQAFEQRAAAAGFARKDVGVIVRSGALESAIGDKISPSLVASDADTRAQYDSIVEQVGKIPLTYQQAKPYLSRFIVSEQRSAKLRPILAQAESKDPISVNPRFGRWDTKQFAIVSEDGTVASSPAPKPILDLTTQS